MKKTITAIALTLGALFVSPVDAKLLYGDDVHVILYNKCIHFSTEANDYTIDTKKSGLLYEDYLKCLVKVAHDGAKSGMWTGAVGYYSAIGLGDGNIHIMYEWNRMLDIDPIAGEPQRHQLQP